MDFSPLSYRINRILTGGRRFDYKDVCEKSWVICPPPDPSRKLPSAIALDGQFDRVTASFPHASIARDRAILADEWKEVRATTAYLLKNASLLYGYVYKGPMKYMVVSDREKEKWLSMAKTEFIDKGALACSQAGNDFYSHWMTDNLTLELAAKELAEPILCKHNPYNHAADYRKFFELGPETVQPVLRCSELIIIDDVSQNDYKRERYNLLRNRLKKVGGDRSGHGVMILRGTSGRELRLLVNESEVAQYLADRGFTIIDPQSMSVKEIVRSIQGAKIVVGVEGSTMAHGFFSIADGGTIFILQPPYRFSAMYKEYTDCVGMRFAYVVGYPTPQGFKINLDELAKTLDLIERAQKAV
jgi:capsular polysaccharide biosynthesis protein